MYPGKVHVFCSEISDIVVRKSSGLHDYPLVLLFLGMEQDLVLRHDARERNEIVHGSEEVISVG